MEDLVQRETLQKIQTLPPSGAVVGSWSQLGALRWSAALRLDSL